MSIVWQFLKSFRRQGVSYFGLVLLILVFLVAEEAFGRGDNEYRSKLGIDLGTVRTFREDNFGWMTGIRAARYVGESEVHAGLAVNFGVPSGKNPKDDYMYYGGLTLGYDGVMSRDLNYELGFLAGYGRGQFHSKVPAVTETSYFVMEPSFSLGFGLGKGWKLKFTTSYVHMTEADYFSGLKFGFRLEHKTSTTVSPVDK